MIIDTRRFLFFHYSYFSQLFQGALSLLPPLIRNLFYKLMLKKMGSNVFIETGVYFRYPHRISIGNNVSINRRCSLYASYHFPEVEIVLGNNIRIGPGVNFFAAGHDHSSLKLKDTGDSIYVKDYVWIGGNSTILQGVTVGEGSVIGAGSVVTENVPPYKIFAGVPAREIGDRKLNKNTA